MKRSWMSGSSVLVALIAAAGLLALGCEDSGTCFYQCEGGLLGLLEEVEDAETCEVQAGNECNAAADQGGADRTEFSTECADEGGDAGEDDCAPDWFELVPPHLYV